MSGPERPRGLGTRLSNILPGATAEHRSPAGGVSAIIPPASASRAAGASAGASRRAPTGSLGPAGSSRTAAFPALAVLQRAFSLDLCARVRQRRGKPQTVQVTLVPELAASSRSALSLSDELIELFDPEPPNRAGTVGGLSFLAVEASDKTSRTLYVLARRAPVLDDADKELAERICRALARSRAR